MDNLIGSWKSKKDMTVRLTNGVFTLKERSIVSVKQIDKERRKVLIEFGPIASGWKHKNFLNNFEKLD